VEAKVKFTQCLCKIMQLQEATQEAERLWRNLKSISDLKPQFAELMGLAQNRRDAFVAAGNHSVVEVEALSELEIRFQGLQKAAIDAQARLEKRESMSLPCCAQREVLREEAPQEFLSVDREESLALHERLQTESNARAPSDSLQTEWHCSGPGCTTYLRDKSEWRRHSDKKAGATHYYCLQCWRNIVSNVVWCKVRET